MKLRFLRNHPSYPLRSARGAFDNSPQFQLRVRGAQTQFVPAGRLNFLLAPAVGCLGSHVFSRPRGANGVGRTPPAVETAGYYQFVPAGQEDEKPPEKAFLKGRTRTADRFGKLRLLTSSATLSVALLCGPSARASGFAFGADLSFLKQAEDRGTTFHDGTNTSPGLQMFQEHGYNWIRLRIFVEPVSNNLPNGLAYTLAMAKEAKQLGYKFLLDFHYANSWADPGQQPTPGTWINLSHPDRVQAVFAYTRDTIAAFRDAGVLPDMVQVGNEIAHGMLWPDGMISGALGKFHRLSPRRHPGRGRRARHAIRRPKIMIHIDQGGNLARTKWFFDNLNHYQISYDVIGLSYYPWWQGTLMDLRENLAFAAKTYGKDVIVVETAYHWRPARETADRPEPFPETPAGQREFLDEVTRIVLAVPDNRGQGIFWWEPAVGGRSGLVTRSFFDEADNALPALSAFDKYTRPAPKTKGH